MSGSGGGGGTPVTPKTPCEEIEIETHISSPKPGVLKGLAVGEILQVELDNAGKVSHVVLKRNGVVAGGLASQRAFELRDCMESGHKYQAKVTNIAGGHFSVKVTSA
jgi:hypothetical protein